MESDERKDEIKKILGEVQWLPLVMVSFGISYGSKNIWFSLLGLTFSILTAIYISTRIKKVREMLERLP